MRHMHTYGVCVFVAGHGQASRKMGFLMRRGLVAEVDSFDGFNNNNMVNTTSNNTTSRYVHTLINL